MQHYLHQAWHLGWILRAHEDTVLSVLPSLHFSSAQSHSFIPLLLSHIPTHPPIHYTQCAVWVPSRFTAWCCRRTGRHSASLRMHCICSAVCVWGTVSNGINVHACANCVSIWVPECQMLYMSNAFVFVYVHFSRSVCFNQSWLTHNQWFECNFKK